MKAIACLFLAFLASPLSAVAAAREQPALIAAIERGDRDAARRHVQSYGPLNSSSEINHPPLHVAAALGRVEIMRDLIAQGADPNFKDSRRQETPLHMAIDGAQLTAAKLLIEKGSDLEADMNGGGTALTEACFDGNLPIVKVLVEAGAKVNAPIKPLWTPLTAAAQEAKLELVDYLLSKGANPNLASNGGTPLHYAAISDVDFEAKVRTLLRSGAKLDSPGRYYGWTSIHWAAFKGRESVIKMLVGAGEDPRRLDTKGRSIADIAAEEGHDEVAKRLRKMIAAPH